MKCSVCGKRFVPRKENVYQVSETANVLVKLVTPDAMYDAIDCPRCGCQRKLMMRMPRIRLEEAQSE